MLSRVAGGAGWAAWMDWATSVVLTQPATLKLSQIDYHDRLWFVFSPETVTPVRFWQKILIELKSIRVIKSVSENRSENRLKRSLASQLVKTPCESTKKANRFGAHLVH